MEREGCIVPILLETEANKDFLRDIPHRKILNLSMVYKYAFDNKSGRRYSAFVKKGSEAELYKMAISNIEPKCQDVLKVLSEFKLLPEEVQELEDTINPMYVVTNGIGIEGASSIFKPGVLAGLAEQLDSNLIVLPSSIHECIVMMDNGIMDEGEIAEMVYHTNMTTVDEKDRLSDLPMYYNRETGSLSLLEDREGDFVVIDKA